MEVLDMKDACEFLKIARQTLYKYVRTGEIPAFKVGKVWRFHRESLDTWARNRVKEDTSTRRRNTIDETDNHIDN